MKLRLLAIVCAATLGVGSTVAFAASLNVGSWHMWAGSQTLIKGTCSLSGAASTTDTYVVKNNAGTSFGSLATLGNIPSGDAPKEQWSFVRFDLSSCNLPVSAGADAATMSLYLSRAPTTSFNYDLTRALSGWTNSLTWSAAQSLGYATSATTSPASGTTNGVWISFMVTGDVDAFIKGATNEGWRLSSTGKGKSANKDTSLFAATDSGANMPTLTINYEK